MCAVPIASESSKSEVDSDEYLDEDIDERVAEESARAHGLVTLYRRWQYFRHVWCARLRLQTLAGHAGKKVRRGGQGDCVHISGSAPSLFHISHVYGESPDETVANNVQSDECDSPSESARTSDGYPSWIMSLYPGVMKDIKNVQPLLVTMRSQQWWEFCSSMFCWQSNYTNLTGGSKIGSDSRSSPGSDEPLLPVPFIRLRLVETLSCITSVSFVDDDVVCESFSVTEEIFLLNSLDNANTVPSSRNVATSAAGHVNPQEGPKKRCVLDLHANVQVRQKILCLLKCLLPISIYACY